jgi:hypothetical protein
MEQLVLSLIVGLLCAGYIFSDAKKRGMSSAWALLGFLIGIFGLIIYLIARKKTKTSQDDLTTINNSQVNTSTAFESIRQSTELIIPDHCPQCKNPNTKKIRLCEWCGNQIC